jgi:DNA-binding FadR family transcriptional regulator
VVIGSETRSGTAGRLHESAQEQIKEYILARGLKGGDALQTEGRLAQALGISRTSVREAVKALESLGILEARPGVGLFVRTFSFDPIVDNLGYSLAFDGHRLAELLAVRKHLEAGFVEDVAGRATPTQLRVLRSVVDRMGERVALETQTTDFQEEDRFFHRTLYGGLGNELLLKLLDVFWTTYRRLRDQARVEAVDPVRTWEDHRRIVEALERRDGAAARAAMVRHFAGVEGRLRAALQDAKDAAGRAGDTPTPGGGPR